MEKLHKKECPKKKECGVNDCKKFHHPLLHNDSITPDPTQEGQEQEKADKNPQITATVFKKGDVVTHFRLIPVRVYANGKAVEVNAFFDEGSAPTLMTKELAAELGITGDRDPLCLAWTDNSCRTEEDSERVSIEISGIDIDKKYKLTDVRTVAADHLNLPKPSWNLEELRASCGHLKGLKIIPPFPKKPAILIGLEHAKLGVARATREGSWQQPIATRTLLGWVIHGKFKGDVKEGPERSCYICECGDDRDLNKLVEGFFTTENIGIRSDLKTLESEATVRARSILERSTKLMNGRYETGLLWKSDDVSLPDSKPMALRRLLCLERQLLKNPQQFQAVSEKIQENISKGFVRKLTPVEAAKHTQLKIWREKFVRKKRIIRSFSSFFYVRFVR